MLRCVFCGFCVDACPEEAIIMSRETEICAFTREETLWDIETLMSRPELPEFGLGYRPNENLVESRLAFVPKEKVQKRLCRARHTEGRGGDDPSCHLRPEQGLSAIRWASASCQRMSTTASRRRARGENFPISGYNPFPSFVTATVLIKKAAARANSALGALDPKIADAIERAADEVLGGGLRDQFVVDPFQAGAGTSHHMNVNEVLANRAIELLGGEKGDYSIVHPNDHVNMGQSTNDVIPTAIRLAALELVSNLVPELDHLANAFRAKAVEFDRIVKSGRTHLQDAVPVRLGQEFGGVRDCCDEEYGSNLEGRD